MKTALTVVLLFGVAAAPLRVASAAGTDKLKIAVMDLTLPAGTSPELASALDAAITEALDRLGAFAPISSREVRRMLELEANKQFLGCDGGSDCLAEIGGALGADYAITGSLTADARAYVLQLQLTNTRAVRVEGRASREYSGPEGGLIDTVRSVTRAVVRELLAARSGTLRVRVAEEGATIKVDDSIVGISPLAMPVSLAGGPHTVTVEKEGFVRFQRDLQTQAGFELGLEVALVPSVDYVREYRAHAGTLRVAAWTVVGLGAASLAASGVLFAKSHSDAASLNRRIDAYNAATVKTASEASDLHASEKQVARLDAAVLGAALGGAAAVGVGVLLRVFGADPDRYGPAPLATVVPAVGGGALPVWGVAISF
jgi:hypothetical protein